jgi:hypothetical protein
LQIRKNRSAILILIYILVGIYFFLLGENGILERMKLAKNREKITSNISGLARENQKLQKEYSIISNDKTNRNFYKEEASKSGYIAGKEKYIFFKNTGNTGSLEIVNIKEDTYPIPVSQMRIIWIVSSIIIVSLYIWRKNYERKKEDDSLQDS